MKLFKSKEDKRAYLHIGDSDKIMPHDVITFLEDNASKTGYSSTGLGEEELNFINAQFKSGNDIYPFLQPNFHLSWMESISELIHESEQEFPIFKFLFNSKISFSADAAKYLIGIGSSVEKMQLFMEMIYAEQECNKHLGGLNRIHCAMNKLPELCQEYVGEKSAYDIIFIGACIARNENFKVFKDRDYDETLFCIISYGLNNGLSSSEIDSMMDSIEQSDNFHHFLYFNISCKINKLNEKYKNINIETILKCLKDKPYTSISEINPISDILSYHSLDKCSSSKSYDVTHYLNEITDELMWDNINLIVNSVFFSRYNIFNGFGDIYGFEHQSYDEISKFGQLTLHRNFSKIFSVNILDELTKLSPNQLDQIKLGLNDDLDVTKYIDLDNTSETMSEVRMNLRQIKINNLSGLPNNGDNNGKAKQEK